MQVLIDSLATDPESLLKAIAIPVLGLVAIFALILHSGNTKERERTRRDVAAYVAEGTMTPEDAERLLAAGRKCAKK